MDILDELALSGAYRALRDLTPIGIADDDPLTNLASRMLILHYKMERRDINPVAVYNFNDVAYVRTLNAASRALDIAVQRSGLVN